MPSGGDNEMLSGRWQRQIVTHTSAGGFGGDQEDRLVTGCPGQPQVQVSLLAKVTLYSPTKKFKVSHSHLFIKVALCFLCFHKNSTGSASPTLHTPNCQKQHKQPLHHAQDSHGSPGGDHFAILPHDAHMLGVLFLAAGLNCLHRSGLLYSKRMTERGWRRN